MDWPTMDQELAAAKNEIEELKKKLHEKEHAFRDLEMDLNFHATKAQEFEEIIKHTDPDEKQHQLRAKILQNAGLTAQVQTLRVELGQSSMREANMEKIVKSQSDKVKQLEEELLSHQGMLVQLGNLVRSLGPVDNQHQNTDDFDESDFRTADLSFENIKIKIHTIDDDRKKRIQENQELQTDRFEKAIVIDSYEKQMKQLLAEQECHEHLVAELKDVERVVIEIATGQVDMDDGGESESTTTPHESLERIRTMIPALEDDRRKHVEIKNELQKELANKTTDLDSSAQKIQQLQGEADQMQRIERERDDLQIALESKNTLIKSLEQSLASKFGHPALDNVPSNIEYEYQKYVGENAEGIEVELGVDGSDVITPSAASTFATQTSAHRRSLHSEDGSSTDEDFSFSFSSVGSAEGVPSLDNALAENYQIQITLRKEIDDLKTRLIVMRRQEDSAHAVQLSLRNEIGDLKGELAETREQVKASKKKQELREKLLRDLIFQYKELQKEHDDATSRLQFWKQQAACDYRQVDADDPAQRPSAGRPSVKRQKIMPFRRISPAAIEESSTFEETIDSSAGTNTLSMDATPTGSVQLTGIEVVQMDKDYARLEKDAARLEHEYEVALTQMANLEQDLDKARAELERVRVANVEKTGKLSEIQQKYDTLQVDHSTVVERTSQLEIELDQAKKNAEETHRHLKEREQDLLEVINQYHELAKDHEGTVTKLQGVQQQLVTTEARLACVEHELAITARHTKRKDLIYDHLKMERQIQGYRRQVESLCRQLKQAKSDAARSKEETKGTRKRLVGCHFQYRQLQGQYSEIVTFLEEVEKDLDKAERRLELYESQQESLKTKMEQVQKLRQKETIQNQKLRQENTQLIDAYCKDILKLASEHVEVF